MSVSTSTKKHPRDGGDEELPQPKRPSPEASASDDQDKSQADDQTNGDAEDSGDEEAESDEAEQEYANEMEAHRRAVRNPNGLHAVGCLIAGNPQLEFFANAAKAVVEADRKWWPEITAWLRTLPTHPAAFEASITRQLWGLGLDDGCPDYVRHVPCFRVYADLSPAGRAAAPASVRDTVYAAFDRKEFQVDFEFRKGHNFQLPPLDPTKLMLGYWMEFAGGRESRFFTLFTDDDCKLVMPDEEKGTPGCSDPDAPTAPTDEERKSGSVFWNGAAIISGPKVEAGEYFFLENSIRPASAPVASNCLLPGPIRGGVGSTTLFKARDAMRKQAFEAFCQKAGRTSTKFVAMVEDQGEEATSTKEKAKEVEHQVMAVLNVRIVPELGTVVVDVLLDNNHEVAVSLKKIRGFTP